MKTNLSILEKGGGCDKNKDEDMPEEGTQAKEVHVKETLRNTSQPWRLI